MKQSRKIFGCLSLILMGGMCGHLDVANATPSVITFSNISLVNSVTAQNNSQTSQFNFPNSLANADTLTKVVSTAPVFGAQGQTTSSITTMSPASTKTNPSPDAIFITQSLGFSYTQGGGSFNHPNRYFATENSIFSADFRYTGSHPSLYVNYFPGQISATGSFLYFPNYSSTIVITVKDLSPHPKGGYFPGNALLFGDNGASGAPYGMFGFTGGAGPYGNGGFPGPFFLDFTTASPDLYNITVNMQTGLFGSNGFSSGTDSATFDLVANTPEPSTWLLFGTGMALMGFMELRKRKDLLA
ncbi:MAG: PEP-CTERM sorting domain-containing protein [Leptospirales bacterium]